MKKHLNLTKKECLKRAARYGVTVLLTHNQPKLNKGESLQMNSHELLKGYKGVYTCGLMLSPMKSAYPVLKKHLENNAQDTWTMLERDIFENLCAWASKVCARACLGPNAGRGQMEGTTLARAKRTWFMFGDNVAFMALLMFELDKHILRAKKLNMLPAFRADTVSDINLGGHFVFMYPELYLYDYTASIDRALQWKKESHLVKNRYFTFSAKEDNWSACVKALKAGINVAVPIKYEKSEGIPKSFKGFLTFDADLHDARFLDPQEDIGRIAVLYPKGPKAKKDSSGFVHQWAKDALFI